jgi:hypothetical protein
MVSLEPDVYERYDPKLLSRLSPDIEIIRQRDPWQALLSSLSRRTERVARLVGGPAADGAPLWSRITAIVRRADAWFYHPNYAMCWILPAVKTA